MTLLVDHLITTLSRRAADAPADATLEELTLLKRQVHRLTALVVQMLDVSLITAGGLKLVPTRVDLREVVRDVINRFDLELQQRHVKVVLDAPQPVSGKWDEGRVDQIVTNLISNALKYGAGRPIKISVSRRDSAGRPRGPRPWRRHPGRRTGSGSSVRSPAPRPPGITPGSAWVCGSPSRSPRPAAAGLLVESRPDEGSTFTVELPL